MLETTFATRFTPGINTKGSVTGANWVFLLPHLDLKRVVCVGPPSTATLGTLARLGQTVVVLCRDAAQAQLVAASSAYLGVTNVSCLQDEAAASLPEGSADLLVLGSRWTSRNVATRRRLCQIVERLRAPSGFVYFEVRGPTGRAAARKLMRATVGDQHAALVFWATPGRGEIHTAVPETDQTAINYFFDRRLYSSAVDPYLLDLAKQLFVKRRSDSASSPMAVPPAPTSSRRRIRQLLRGRAAHAGVGMLRLLGDAEWFAHKHGAPFRRYGVLVGGPSEATSTAPPAYLRAIAADGGCDLSQHRWALSAPGEYSSRKVVFLLFGPGGAAPEYIVKMTRDRRFNARLVNEQRALTTLWERGAAKHVGAPRVAFFGEHHGLAVIGETAVTGVPFAQRTRHTAECPIAETVIHSLIELGAATADRTAVQPLAAAERLGALFKQFVDVYNPLPEHRSFLCDQLDTLAGSRSAFPLVFQHGDPGTWNVLVTPAGEAAFLDWEAAEPHGLPLWDLLYFLRSYSGDVARVRGVQSRLQGFAQLFLAETSLSQLLVRSVERYRQRIHLSQDVVAPLLYTCWMHRALKEATRMVPEKLQSGLYVSLLRLCIEQRNAPTLRALFGA